MKNHSILVILSTLLFAVGVVFFSMGIIEYQVSTNSRASEGTPTPTPVLDNQQLDDAGWAVLCRVDNSELTSPKINPPGYPYELHPDERYNGVTPPVGVDACYSWPRLKAGTTDDYDFSIWDNGYCNLEEKSCFGPRVEMYICDAPGKINWASLEDNSDGEPRACAPSIPESSPFTYESKQVATGGETLTIPEDLGCGKVVQMDVFFENCNEYEGQCWYDYFVYYTGQCENTPTPPAQNTPTDEPEPTATPVPPTCNESCNTEADNCNEGLTCYDEDSDGEGVCRNPEYPEQANCAEPTPTVTNVPTPTDEPEPTATPVPPTCNESCNTEADNCNEGLTCYDEDSDGEGVCRNPEYPEQANCAEPTPTVTNVPTATVTPTATNTPTSTPVPTSTLVPTATPVPPEPTWTQVPTWTPVPQPTSVPPQQPTATPITKLVVNDQPPGFNPWFALLIPFGLVALGLAL